ADPDAMISGTANGRPSFSLRTCAPLLETQALTVQEYGPLSEGNGVVPSPGLKEAPSPQPHVGICRVDTPRLIAGFDCANIQLFCVFSNNSPNDRYCFR